MKRAFTMPNLASWIREKDEKYFGPIFEKYPDIKVWNARISGVPLDEMDGLLLTGGSDISPDFLGQEVPDPSVLSKDIDPARDDWEFAATKDALVRATPIFAICKGLQVFNVALGGTLKLDIPGHNLPEQRDHNIQPLRYDGAAQHRLSRVNSAHHQAIDRLGDDLEVEAWCATDDVIEQVRLKNHPFAFAVQYHPERDETYEALFKDFFSRLGRDNR